MYSNDNRVILTCIKWNEDQAKKAKNPRDRKRYFGNIERLKSLMENGDEA